ncbi:SAP18 family protein [Aspergillus fijiensis CBS 313.89]|uniref:Sin3-associated polypeptide Sap18 n=1 Tax=Aspergillus fijiensis CBS 313.89 TaxID=1448319 RepID=A0A8G1RVW8_9EURO|nr:uncharacterized protein BO72DRAFT_526887 [Aspergillus fijiensis CBS 313.89]RAK78506.1 hypothetical protein BO72DRAFT_526887 [Aspergillus fijiensis CBS 313.89]
MSMSRQTTTPFHLKLFYRQSTYHPLSDFSPASANPAGRSGGHLPAHHLQIYTWPSCSLRELAHLLTSTLPHLLPEVPIGTRLSFRLIYPDTKGAAMNLGEHGRGRYLAKEMGSVVVAPRGYDDDTDSNEGGKGEGEGEGEGGGHGSKARAAAAGAFRMSGADAEKTLQDFRFVIGDYVDCAIVPPLEDGSVAPPPPVGSGGGGGGGEQMDPAS